MELLNLSMDTCLGLYGTMNNCMELLNLSMEFEYECKELGIFI